MRDELLALLVLFVVVASAVSSRARQSPRPAKGLGGTIGLVGDSYAVGLSTPLANLLPDDGFLVGRSEVGAHTLEILSWVPKAIEQGATRVLISAGTNDHAASAAQLVKIRAEAALLEKTVRGVVELIWLESPSVKLRVAPTGARTLTPPKMQLVDGLHPSGDGYRKWARKITEEL
jgi:hypothetical protein